MNKEQRRRLLLIFGLILAAILVPLILGIVGIVLIRSTKVLTVLVVVLIAAAAVIAWRGGVGRSDRERGIRRKEEKEKTDHNGR
ncbi:hypothetical protein [uncultured Pseudoramibacter sp.]|jgi:predicted tellurium resistance membrane protein TerC|uniref:hypothetical protein n=1 Tax=uncultured Pseudoramibacter sp. TaxID=1623493 RepID=UPI0025FAD488|nr:hypothetical protein [uncultured Pseudoramibacter sp.]